MDPFWSVFRCIALGAMLLSVASAATSPIKPLKSTPWRGVHLGVGNDADLKNVAAQLPTLTAAGVNAIVLEVDYSFQFQSRPEMFNPKGITADGAKQFADLCRSSHVRLIPQINCLGHQSWAEKTDSLLTIHPELDETPGLYPNNKDIYCRSWCPLHPELHEVLFPLIDELIDAFHADAFSVGMDEVFLIGTPGCPRCKGKSTAELFAKAVNDLHDHIVGKRHKEMFMWGDRLLDGRATGYGEWEASEVGTAPAIDRIPKDIVMCDWHYEKMDRYPSVQIFVQHGFRVWPSTWRDPEAATRFCAAAKTVNDPHVVGVLVTTWGAVKPEALATWPAFLAAMAAWK